MCQRCLSNWYFEKDGQLYCRHDYWSKFGTACNRCSQLITGPLMVCVGRGGGGGGGGEAEGRRGLGCVCPGVGGRGECVWKGGGMWMDGCAFIRVCGSG